MPLSKTAKTILANPKKYLYIRHDQRKPVNPSHIWAQTHVIGDLGSEEFSGALQDIRKVASKRGPCDEDKNLVLDSILEYTTKVISDFKNINQINNHLKGIFGCELPMKFRKSVRQAMSSTPQVEVSTPTPQVEVSTPTPQAVVEVSESSTSFTIGEVEFTLSKGASLNIGVLQTKTLDFKGMKSVAIERVADGKIFGVNLQS